jgi:hypothetical protein
MPLPPWLSRLRALLRRARRRSARNPIQYLHPLLELLERRDLFSLNVWLPQRLLVVGGTTDYLFGQHVLQPATTELLPQFSLNTATIAIAGSLTLADTGAYDIALSQSGPDGGNAFFFTETGTVTFALAENGHLTKSALVPDDIHLTQTVSLSWAFVEINGAGATVQSLNGTDTFPLTTTTAPDAGFWAGFNWQPITQHLSDLCGLNLFSLSATSFSVTEAGSENYTLAVPSGLATVAGTGTQPLNDTDQSGQQNAVTTLTSAFAASRSGSNTFTLFEGGTYGAGSYALGSVAYSETGTETVAYSESGTLSAGGTAAGSGLQSFGGTKFTSRETSSSGFQFASLTTFDYAEGASGTYTASARGSYGSGTFSLGSVAYAGSGTGLDTVNLHSVETDNGTFAATDTGTSLDSSGIAGTATDGGVSRDGGTFTQTQDTTRGESAAGTYSRSLAGSYAGGSYALANFSLTATAAGTFTLLQLGTLASTGTGSALGSGAGTDSFDLAFGTTTDQSGLTTETYATTSSYANQASSVDCLSQSGTSAATLTQSGSAAAGSVSLSCFVLSTTQSGSGTHTTVSGSTESGSETSADQGTDASTDSTTYATTTDGGSDSSSFTSGDSAGYTSGDGSTAVETTAFSNSAYRAGQFAAGSWNLSSVVLTQSGFTTYARSGSSTNTTTGLGTQADFGRSLGTTKLSYAQASYADSGGNTFTDSGSGTFVQVNTSSSSASGTDSFSSRMEGVYAGFSYAFGTVVYQDDTAETGTTVEGALGSYTNGTYETYASVELSGQSFGDVTTPTQTDQGTFSEGGGDFSGTTGTSSALQTTNYSATSSVVQQGSLVGGSFNLASVVQTSAGTSVWQRQETTSSTTNGNVHSSNTVKRVLAGVTFGGGTMTQQVDGTFTSFDSSTQTSNGTSTNYQYQEGAFANYSLALDSFVQQNNDTSVGTITAESRTSSTTTIALSYTSDTGNPDDAADGGTTEGNDSGLQTVVQTAASSSRQTTTFTTSAAQYQAGRSSLGSSSLGSTAYDNSSLQTVISLETQTAAETGTAQGGGLQTGVSGDTLSYGGDPDVGANAGTVQLTLDSEWHALSSSVQAGTTSHFEHQAGAGRYSNFSYQLDSYLSQLQDSSTGSLTQSNATDSATDSSQSFTFATLATLADGSPKVIRSGSSDDSQAQGSAFTESQYNASTTSWSLSGQFANGSYNLDSVASTSSSVDSWAQSRQDWSTDTLTTAWTAVGVRAGSVSFGTVSFGGLGQQSFTRKSTETVTTGAETSYGESGTITATYSQLGIFAGYCYAYSSVVQTRQGTQSTTEHTANTQEHDSSGKDAFTAAVTFAAADTVSTGGYSAAGSFAASGLSTFAAADSFQSAFDNAAQSSFALYEDGSFANDSYAFGSVAYAEDQLSTFSSAETHGSEGGESRVQGYYGSAALATTLTGLVSFTSTVTSSQERFDTDVQLQAGTASTHQVNLGCYQDGCFAYGSMVYQETGLSHNTLQQLGGQTFESESFDSVTLRGTQATPSANTLVSSGTDSFTSRHLATGLQSGTQSVSLLQTATSGLTVLQGGGFADDTWSLASVVNTRKNVERFSQEEDSSSAGSGTDCWSLSTLTTGNGPGGQYGLVTITATSDSQSSFSQDSRSTTTAAGRAVATVVQTGSFSNGTFAFDHLDSTRRDTSAATYQETSHGSRSATGTSSWVREAQSNASFAAGAGSFSAGVETTSSDWGNESRSLTRLALTTNTLRQQGLFDGSTWAVTSVVQHDRSWQSTTLSQVDTDGGTSLETDSTYQNFTAATALASFTVPQGTLTSYLVETDGTTEALRDATQTLAQTTTDSWTLTRLGSLDTLGKQAFSSIAYQEQATNSMTWSQGGLASLHGTGSEHSAFSAGSAALGMFPPLLGVFYTPGTFSHDGSSDFEFDRLQPSAATITSSDSFSLFQAGSFTTAAGYTLTAMTLQESSANASSSWQTNALSESGSGSGADTVTLSNSSLVQATTSTSTFVNDETQAQTQADSTSLTLYESGSYVGRWGLDTIAVDSAGTSALTLSDDQTQGSTQTVEQVRGVDHPSGRQDLVNTGQSASTFSLLDTALLTYAAHALGSATRSGSSLYPSLASYAYDAAASGTQSSTYTHLDTQASNGFSNGTFGLGLADGAHGSATLQDTSWQGGTVQDSRSFSLAQHLEESGAGSAGALNSYALVVDSDARWTAQLADGSAQTIAGVVANTTAEFGDDSLASSALLVQQQGTSHLSVLYRPGTGDPDEGGTPAGYSYQLNAAGVGTFNGSKGTYEGWERDHSSAGDTVVGTDNFAAAGLGAASFALAEQGSDDGSAGFTLTGGATGCFQSTETGSQDWTYFGHTYELRMANQLYSQGARSAGGTTASLTSYNASAHSFTTYGDEVGGSRATRTLAGTFGLAGSGQTGPYSTQGLWTFTHSGTSDETGTYGTSGTAYFPFPGGSAAGDSLAAPGAGEPEGFGWAALASLAATPGPLPAALAAPQPAGLVAAARPDLPTLPLPQLNLLGATTRWRLGLTIAVWTGPTVVTPVGDQPNAHAEPTVLGQVWQIQDSSRGNWQLWSWLPDASGGAWQQVESSHHGPWDALAAAQRTGDPLNLPQPEQWLNQAFAQLDEFRHDWARRTAAFSIGLVDTVTAGVLRTAVGRYFLMGPVSLLMPSSTFEVSSYYTKTGAYRWGTYAGQAVNIALTVWTPVGVLGTAVQALHIVQTVGGAGQAAEAAANGNWEQAGIMALGAALSALRGVGPCKVGQTSGNLVGRLLGDRAASVAGFIGTWGSKAFGVAMAVRGASEGLDRIKEGDWLGGALQIAQSAADVYAMRGSCLTRETELLTRYGFKRIDTFVPGDKLLARSELDPFGPLEEKEVEAVLATYARILHVHVGGQVIRTTGEHPFFVKQAWDFVAANELRPGDQFLSHDGQWVAVEEVLDTGEYEPVFNLSIADYHTYFVGGWAWGFSVWAHNSRSCETENASASSQTQQRRLTRQQGQKVIDEAQRYLPTWSKNRRVLTLTELEDGRYVLTMASKQRTPTSNRNGRSSQTLQDMYTIPPDAVDAARAALQHELGNRAQLLVPSQHAHGGYIPVNQRVLANAPGESGWHGEGRGIQAGIVYGSPARRQWSSLGEPQSRGWRGAACPDCEALQRQRGVINETGFQNWGGRFDSYGLNPYWNWYHR